jgi:hypothetical protein
MKSRLILAPFLLAALSFGQQPAPAQAKPQGLAVPYKLPADGEVTLGLYDTNEHLVRWLIQGEYRYSGNNSETWDGLDQYGHPAPAGSYTVKGIYHSPITTDYKMSVANPGNPPWPTADDKGDWLSDEFDPQTAVSDGRWVYLGAPGNELGWSVIAVDETGQRQWGMRTPIGGRAISLALSGNYLYVVFSGAELTDGTRSFNGKNAIGKAFLMCFDKRTGKPAQFTLKQPSLVVATWPYHADYTWLDVLRNGKSFTPQVYGGQPRYFDMDVGETTNALGLAAAGGRLYISLNYENKLLAVDPASGHPTGDDVHVDNPVGLTALDNHTLLAVSGTQVVRVDTRSKAVTPLITSGLVAPDSIPTDKAGSIYVSDWATSFQVKVFSPAGKFLRAIGKEGGRPWVGKWDPNGMLVPRGVAVTDAGKLWVAEDDGSPKRISVWNASTGAVIREYIGPTQYGGAALFWIDPKDPTLAHAEATAFKLDYARKTYTPLAIDFRRRNRDDPFTPNGHDIWPRQGRILYHGGHEYLVSRSKMTVILQRTADGYRPVAALGNDYNGFGNDGTFMIDWDSLGYHPFKGYFPDNFKGHAGDNFSWTDMNGDNLVQPDEMHWVKTTKAPLQQGTQPTLGSYWGWDISPDWSHFAAGTFQDHAAIFRIDVKGWTPAGAPIYDMADAKPIILLPPKHAIGNLYVTDDKKLIVIFGYEGLGQFNDNTDSISCYDLDGKLLWSIALPKELTGKGVHANGAEYDFHIPGIGDVFGTWLYHGSKLPFLITTDGLYVGTLLEDTLLGPTSLRGESSLYYYQAPDGTPYVINGANQAEHIFQIKGLDHGGRFEGTIQLTDSDTRRAMAFRAMPKPVVAPKAVVDVTWLSRPPVIDGDLSDWNLREGVSISGTNGRSAAISLARDAGNLYLAYKVQEPTPPMRNEGSDWRSLFITGDCVDLMLQSDPKADPHHRTPMPGDERLLMSVFQGKPIAVLYRPSVPGTASPVSLAAARIDQIVRLDSARLAIKPDVAGKSYTVEASVPLRDLNLNPHFADNLRGDVGVIFADESGRSRSLRLYYYNHDTAMVDDLATEATLQPNEWGTLAMPLGPNLLQNGSFEAPLVNSAQDVTRGWFVDKAVNGNNAFISSDSTYSGHQSLQLKAVSPTVYTPDAWNNPDYGAFIKSANGGKGVGEVEVRQRVSVIAGHQYSFRFAFRSENYTGGGEIRKPGHPRGFVSFVSRIEWFCPPPSPNHGKQVPVAGPYDTTSILRPIPDWMVIYNTHPPDPPGPYIAPDGCIAADIVFDMRNATDDQPRFYVDDAEFVDTGGQPPQ